VFFQWPQESLRRHSKPVASARLDGLLCKTLVSRLPVFLLILIALHQGYDPNRSRVSDDKMASWNETALDGSLTQVPGIGAAATRKLVAAGITNSYQLLGTYMKFSQLEDVGTGEIVVDTFSLNQRFWAYLQELGINVHRSAIVKAVSGKVATMLPGFLDANTYDSL
jgi:hypothetical protein